MLTTRPGETNARPIWEYPVDEVRYSLQYILFDICEDNRAPYVDALTHRQLTMRRVKRLNYYYCSLFLETAQEIKTTGQYAERWPTLNELIFDLVATTVHNSRIDASGNFWVYEAEHIFSAIHEWLKTAPPLIFFNVH